MSSRNKSKVKETYHHTTHTNHHHSTEISLLMSDVEHVVHVESKDHWPGHNVICSCSPLSLTYPWLCYSFHSGFFLCSCWLTAVNDDRCYSFHLLNSFGAPVHRVNRWAVLLCVWLRSYTNKTLTGCSQRQQPTHPSFEMSRNSALELVQCKPMGIVTSLCAATS